jgi:hypothetical protein
MNGRMKKKLKKMTAHIRTEENAPRLYSPNFLKRKDLKTVWVEPLKHFERKVKAIYKKLGIGGVNEFIQKMSA